MNALRFGYSSRSPWPSALGYGLKVARTPALAPALALLTLLSLSGVSAHAQDVTADEPASIATAKHDLRARRFCLAQDSGMIRGGVSEKYLLMDDQHVLWMFKPACKADAYLEEACFRLATLAGVKTPPVFSVAVNGTLTGSLSRIVATKGTLKGRPPGSLSAGQIEDVQRLQVWEWLVANFDTHCRNFLVDQEDHVIPIDHGLAFRDKDFLRFSLDSDAPWLEASYFREFWEARRAGTITVDPDRSFEMVDRLAALDDTAIAAILRPFAGMLRAQHGYVLKNPYDEVAFRSEDEFIDAVLERKRSLRADFERFYTRMNALRGMPPYHAPAPAMGEGAPGAAGGPASTPWAARVDPADAASLASLASVDAEPVSIAFSDKASPFTPIGRVEAKLSNMLGVLRTKDPRAVIETLNVFFDGKVATLQHFLREEMSRGFTTRQVVDMDFARITVDAAFTARVRHSLPDVLRLLRHRAQFMVSSEPETSAARNAQAVIALIAANPSPGGSLPPDANPALPAIQPPRIDPPPSAEPGPANATVAAPR